MKLMIVIHKKKRKKKRNKKKKKRELLYHSRRHPNPSPQMLNIEIWRQHGSDLVPHERHLRQKLSQLATIRLSDRRPILGIVPTVREHARTLARDRLRGDVLLRLVQPPVELAPKRDRVRAFETQQREGLAERVSARDQLLQKEHRRRGFVDGHAGRTDRRLPRVSLRVERDGAQPGPHRRTAVHRRLLVAVDEQPDEVHVLVHAEHELGDARCSAEEMDVHVGSEFASDVAEMGERLERMGVRAGDEFVNGRERVGFYVFENERVNIRCGNEIEQTKAIGEDASVDHEFTKGGQVNGGYGRLGNEFHKAPEVEGFQRRAGS